MDDDDEPPHEPPTATEIEQLDLYSVPIDRVNLMKQKRGLFSSSQVKVASVTLDQTTVLAAHPSPVITTSR